MSSYKIIYNISNILSRISSHGLPETAAAICRIKCARSAESL